MVMVGDGDTEIPMEHTLALRDGLRAQLAVVPGQPVGRRLPHRGRHPVIARPWSGVVRGTDAGVDAGHIHGTRFVG